MKSVRIQNTSVTPTKIVCIGRNFVDHIRELDNEIPSEMVVFIKPNSSIADDIYLHSEEGIHYEGELCFLILNNQIAGVGFGLDLTKRALQTSLKKKGLPWERAKAFDRSAVFSPFVKFDGNLKTLSIKLFINDRLVQHGDSALMLNSPDSILNECQSFLTFEDGDIIMSGTPKGVGLVRKGDKFVAKVYSGDTLIVQSCHSVHEAPNNNQLI